MTYSYPRTVLDLREYEFSTSNEGESRSPFYFVLLFFFSSCYFYLFLEIPDWSFRCT